MHTAPPFPPPALRRRALLGLGAVGLWPGAAPGLPARPLQFPRDHGSHPELRTEWWYITGHAEAAGRHWGFQVTFFRSRVDATQGLRSAFAAKQLLFAHAAVTDVAARNRRLLLEVMTAVGLVNYPREWWHFSYGDQYWACVTGSTQARYGAVEESIFDAE